MKIETKFNIGDKVKFTKDGDLLEARKCFLLLVRLYGYL